MAGAVRFPRILSDTASVLRFVHVLAAFRDVFVSPAPLRIDR